MQDSNPLISIIIPVYNAGHYFRRCLDSVLNQTYGNYELLLIDDCSTDRSGVICDEYHKNDKRIRVIHHSINEGASVARNAGIDISKGKFITFIDADDYVDNVYLAVFLDHLLKVDNNELLFQQIEYSPYPSKKIVYSSYDALCCVSGKLYKAMIIKTYQLRFLANLRYNEDTQFVLRYLNKIHSIYEIKEAHYHYQLNNECSSIKLDANYHETSIGLILLLHQLAHCNFQNEYVEKCTINRIERIYCRFIKALYNYPTSSRSIRRKTLKEVVLCESIAIDQFPIQYKIDRFIRFLLRFRCFYLADIINQNMWNLRKVKKNAK